MSIAIAIAKLTLLCLSLISYSATPGMINDLPEPDVTPNLIVFMDCA